MAIEIALPLLPKGYKAPASFSPLSPPTTSRLEPAGPAFHDHARRILHQRSFADDDAHLAAEAKKNGNGKNEDEDDEDEGLGDEQEEKSLLQSDPKLWKQQDHYAVLGLQSLRYKATDDQIKKAHRRKVLRHHPDKKASGGGSANDDSFFKCIAKAMEVLSSPEKRRQFDSVDEEVSFEVPEVSETTPENFYELWSEVFDRESRFSNSQPVPSLGDAKTEKKDVEGFYNFWYAFDSWRSFEYQDKDANEGTDSRDEKRHQEKKNKADRAAKKKADIGRVRQLVDRALSLDPRIKQFKADEKAAKDAKKKGPGGAPVVSAAEAKKAEEEKRKLEEEQKKEEEKKAAEDKVSREAAKKAKLAAAKNVKKDKKAISTLVVSNNYFVAAGSSPSPAVVEASLSELDLLLGALEPEEVGEVKKEMEEQKAPADIKGVLVKWAKKAEEKVGAGKFKEYSA